MSWKRQDLEEERNDNSAPNSLPPSIDNFQVQRNPSTEPEKHEAKEILTETEDSSRDGTRSSLSNIEDGSWDPFLEESSFQSATSLSAPQDGPVIPDQIQVVEQVLHHLSEDFTLTPILPPKGMPPPQPPSLPPSPSRRIE